MKYIPDVGQPTQRSHDDLASKPVIAFWRIHQNSLWHVARFLAGYEAARLVDRISVSLEHEEAIGDCSRLMLEQLVSTIEMDAYGEPERGYLAYFVVIDPEDPVVAEIAALRNGLTEALAEMDARREWFREKEERKKRRREKNLTAADHQSESDLFGVARR